MARTTDAITEIRQASTEILQAVDKLMALRNEWNQLDYMNTLGSGEDFEGENIGLTTAELAAVIGTTLPALESLLNAGHGTNLQKVRM